MLKYIQVAANNSACTVVIIESHLRTQNQVCDQLRKCQIANYLSD